MVKQAGGKAKRHFWGQEERVTHWMSEWTRARWSLVSCAWSLRGLFPQGPLQGQSQVSPCSYISKQKTGGSSGHCSSCRLTHRLSGGVRVGPGAGTLVALGVCCEAKQVRCMRTREQCNDYPPPPPTLQLFSLFCYSNTSTLYVILLLLHHTQRLCVDSFRV